MQRWKFSREFVTFINKDAFFALRTHTHVLQRLTGQAITLMH